MDTSLPQWFDSAQFPPLAIYYGGEDYLVDAESLLERLKEKEQVRLIRSVRLECEVSQCGLRSIGAVNVKQFSTVISIWLVSYWVEIGLL
jgi:hypothetical protein